MIFTIGFTKTSAQRFFQRLKENKIDVVIDIRLNNKSQLAGFAKHPDIEWFLKEICGIDYIHDLMFAPTEKILKAYQKYEIDWCGYEVQFAKLMDERNIRKYIHEKYTKIQDKNLCLLCSESTSEKCHRRLVSEYFKEVFHYDIVKNL